MATLDELDVTPGVGCIRGTEEICGVTGRTAEWTAGMMVRRHGSGDDAHMTALGLHRTVRRSGVYEVRRGEGLVAVDAGPGVVDMDARAKALEAEGGAAPAHATVMAEWDEDAREEGANENILGDNVVLRVRGTGGVVAVPVVEASEAALAYYGALLLGEGARVRFPNEEPAYPVWKMHLGTGYVDGYIMTPAGKGFYLEWHTDRPHWHQPLTADCGGFYLLAKHVGGAEYHLTGFRIPFGSAVYTSQGAIHCDAALTGANYLVGYTDSEHFSTALVRNEAGGFIRFAGHSE